MPDGFRSRGIRILKDAEKGFTEQMKMYYEPEADFQESRQIRGWMEKGILSLFEISLTESRIVDTYNFHVNLLRKDSAEASPDFREIYGELPLDIQSKLKRIPVLFDESFRNYTVGYRIKNGEVSGQSFYFYPTILKGERYGMKGITDTGKIHGQTKRFSEAASGGSSAAEKEINDFGEILYKLKGVSLHISGGSFGYKLYGRANQRLLERFLDKKMGYQIKRDGQYGEVVLAAQRISQGKVAGYNIYYLA